MLVGDAGAEERLERGAFPTQAQPLGSSARAASRSRRVLRRSQRVAVLCELGEEGLKLRAVLRRPLEERQKSGSRERKEVVHHTDQEFTAHLERGRDTQRKGSERVDPH